MIDWLLRFFARLFVRKMLNPTHVVDQQSDEQDWKWDTPDAEQVEMATIEGRVNSPKEVAEVFEDVSGIFDRGFGERQIEILETVAGRLIMGEFRDFQYLTKRGNKPEQFNVVLAKPDLESIVVRMELAKSVVGFALPRIGADGFEVLESA